MKNKEQKLEIKKSIKSTIDDLFKKKAIEKKEDNSLGDTEKA